jgi:3-deoxy-manno-octulosonate cytidylyltransferase (CMP-KDO synthetase)
MVEHSMRAIGVIPARIGSTRLPAKPLIKILDKCLLQWVIEAVKDRTPLDQILVATDDQRIADLAQTCGVEAVMTDPQLTSGTDRVFQAIAAKDCDLVFNIQGDEPLVRPEWIIGMIAEFKRDPNVQMATVATPLPEKDLLQPSAVKVVLDRNNDAIYFSRFPIPYSRLNITEKPGLAFKHIGLYGFRKAFLRRFCEQPATELERGESLEQLRAMYMGERIRVIKVQGESIGVDTADDVKLLEDRLRQRSK